MCGLSQALPFEMGYFSVYRAKYFVNTTQFIIVKALMLPDLAYTYRNTILSRAESAGSILFTKGLSSSFSSSNCSEMICLSVPAKV